MVRFTNFAAPIQRGVYYSLLHDHAKNHISEIRVALYDANKAIIEINFEKVGDRNFVRIRTVQKLIGKKIWILRIDNIPCWRTISFPRNAERKYNVYVHVALISPDKEDSVVFHGGRTRRIWSYFQSVFFRTWSKIDHRTNRTLIYFLMVFSLESIWYCAL